MTTTQERPPTAAATDTGTETFAAIPAELRTLPQWAVHRAKAPRDPRTGRGAKSNEPATCSTFTEALAALPYYDGLSFLLTATDPYMCIDLDHCRNAETGAIESWAQRIIDLHRSYTEISPSGTGIHIWVRAVLPPEGRKRGNVEMYDDVRFITMTGNHLAGTPTTIERRPVEVLALHRETFGEPAPIAPRQPAPVTDLDDGALLERMWEARNGDKLRRLWSGDQGDYPDSSADGVDGSAADLALCSALAFWSGNDAGRVDALYRQSGLYAGDRRYRGGPKWNRPDYRARTLRLALAGRGYEPRRSLQVARTESIATESDEHHWCAACAPHGRRLSRQNAALVTKVAFLEQELATARRERDEAQLRHSQDLAILRLDGVGAGPLIDILTTIHIAESTKPEKFYEDGSFPAPRWMLEQQSGRSGGTVSKHLKREGALFGIQVQAPWETFTDPETGETVLKKRLRVKIPTDIREQMLRAQLPPTGHGGKRAKRCPDHPNAVLVPACSECGRTDLETVNAGTGEIIEATGVKVQVAPYRSRLSTETPRGVNAQDARLLVTRTLGKRSRAGAPELFERRRGEEWQPQDHDDEDPLFAGGWKICPTCFPEHGRQEIDEPTRAGDVYRCHKCRNPLPGAPKYEGRLPREGAAS
jgi:hypothetical protein